MRNIQRLLGVLLLFGMPSAVQAADSISINPGQAKIFNLEMTNGTFAPKAVRTVKIGQTNPGAGDILISLAPAGHAVGVAKFHVFERSQKPVNFQVVAFQGKKPIATEEVCGRLEMDAWVGLPAETSYAVASKFIEVETECP